MAIHVENVQHVMERLAPLEFAAPWDNVGLMIGSSTWPASSIFLTIDLTGAVLDEAVRAGAELIIAYHPPIFEPLKRLTDRSVKQRIALDAARHGIAVYSPHTALDAAPGGVNDWLAEACGPGDVRALDHHARCPPTEQCKVVTFSPADAIDAIRSAMAASGAGIIGAYTVCSFELAGSGTFLGGESASPVIGQRGRLERVDEVRLEMVSSKAALPLVLTALRQFHPYEEPPIEVYELLPRPMRDTGMGRRVVLDQRTPARALAERLKQALGVEHVRFAPGANSPRRVGAIGLCAGAGGSLVDQAIAQGCEVFVTGEMRHHDVLDAQARGCSVLLAGHTNTERGYLKVLAKRLRSELDSANVVISRMDRDPLRTM